ncbi:MAG: ribonuclease protein component [Enterovirga sp.]|jgi:ribonuclease P protein component|nr:ribonuclease protein component [Enterovirga sp.]
MTREEDLSTLEARPQAAARLPGPYGDRRRSQGHRGAPVARAQAPLGLRQRAAWVRTRRDVALGRLRKRPEFLAAAAGRRFHTERLTLQGRRRPETEAVSGLRVGFTITKRVGHATERNRIRRRLRSAVAEAGFAFAAEPVDIVVVGRRDALSAPYDILIEDLSRGLKAVTRPKAPGRSPDQATKPAPETARERT